MGSLSYLHIVLLLSCTSKASSVLSGQLVHLVKLNLRLIFHNTELTDPVIYMNLGVPHSDHWHSPHIIVTAVRAIDNAAVICLNDSEVLVCACCAARRTITAILKIL